MLNLHFLYMPHTGIESCLKLTQKIFSLKDKKRMPSFVGMESADLLRSQARLLDPTNSQSLAGFRPEDLSARKKAPNRVELMDILEPVFEDSLRFPENRRTAYVHQTGIGTVCGFMGIPVHFLEFSSPTRRRKINRLRRSSGVFTFPSVSAYLAEQKRDFFGSSNSNISRHGLAAVSLTSLWKHYGSSRSGDADAVAVFGTDHDGMGPWVVDAINQSAPTPIARLASEERFGGQATLYDSLLRDRLANPNVGRKRHGLTDDLFETRFARAVLHRDLDDKLVAELIHDRRVRLEEAGTPVDTPMLHQIAMDAYKDPKRSQFLQKAATQIQKMPIEVVKLALRRLLQGDLTLHTFLAEFARIR